MKMLLCDASFSHQCVTFSKVLEVCENSILTPIPSHSDDFSNSHPVPFPQSDFVPFPFSRQRYSHSYSHSHRQPTQFALLICTFVHYENQNVNWTLTIIQSCASAKCSWESYTELMYTKRSSFFIPQSLSSACLPHTHNNWQLEIKH